MKYCVKLLIVIILLLSSCSNLVKELPHSHTLTRLPNGELLSLNIGDKSLVDRGCPMYYGRANACWIYYHGKKLHVIYSIPIQECVDHEMRHVSEGLWHREGWVDPACYQRAKVYYGNKRDKSRDS